MVKESISESRWPFAPDDGGHGEPGRIGGRKNSGRKNVERRVNRVLKNRRREIVIEAEEQRVEEYGGAKYGAVECGEAEE